jgi:hypothetical protein
MVSFQGRTDKIGPCKSGLDSRCGEMSMSAGISLDFVNTTPFDFSDAAPSPNVHGLL